MTTNEVNKRSVIVRAVSFLKDFPGFRQRKPQVADEESSPYDIVIRSMEPEEEWSAFFESVERSCPWSPEVHLSQSLSTEKSEPRCVRETNKVFDGITLWCLGATLRSFPSETSSASNYSSVPQLSRRIQLVPYSNSPQLNLRTNRKEQMSG